MVDRMTRMDREADGNLLLSCLGVEANGRSRAFERLSQRDWDDVLYQSAHHRVAALLYDRLAALPTSAAIPAPVMQQLRDMALQDALSNMRLYDALTEVLTAFAREGVSVIVLKGAHLAEVVYGNRALRPMADADLLVRSRDLARAEATLVGLGYGRLESTTGEVDYAFHHHLRPFVRTGVATIEIHWTVARPIVAFTIDVDGLWARARRAVIAGVEALVLSPEDLLVHVCLHAAFDHHFCFGLRPLCDLSAVIRHHRDEIDWERVRYRACEWSVAKYVYLTLRLARDLVGADVSETVLHSLRPEAFDPRVVTWSKTEIFADDRQASSMSSNLAQMCGPKRFREKAALALRRALPPLNVMARTYSVPHGSRRVYLFYPLRWRDLVRQYGRSAWRLLCRDRDVRRLAERENQRTALLSWLAVADDRIDVRGTNAHAPEQLASVATASCLAAAGQ